MRSARCCRCRLTHGCCEAEAGSGPPDKAAALADEARQIASILGAIIREQPPQCRDYDRNGDPGNTPPFEIALTL
jgi:hypothetical protein